jgi:DNA-binding transcriptional LysR family regulator
MLTGSTNGAAKLLHVSQPAISKMLQHAEQSVGFPLFSRSKGKLIPTQEALLLQQELAPFDAHLKRIRRLVTNLSRGAIQPLRIAATPALAHHLLPPVVARWHRRYPDANCALSVAHTREIEQALLLNEIDLGLTMQPVAHPNLLQTPVRACTVCAIAPEGWWPKERLSQAVQAEELAEHPLISIDNDDFLGAMLSHWLADAGISPQSALSVQTYTLAKALVQVKVGVALVDSFTATYPADLRGIQMRPVDINTGLHVYAVSQQSRPPATSAEAFIAMLKTDGDAAR